MASQTDSTATHDENGFPISRPTWEWGTAYAEMRAERDAALGKLHGAEALVRALVASGDQSRGAVVQARAWLADLRPEGNDG